MDSQCNIGFVIVGGIKFEISCTKELQTVFSKLMLEFDTVSKDSTYKYDSKIIIKEKREYEQQKDFFKEYKTIESNDMVSPILKIEIETNIIYNFVDGGLFFDEQKTYETLRFQIILSMQIILEKYNRFIVHASGAIKDNILILLFGESGAGKSTNILQLIDDGWSFFSDDKILIWLENDSIKFEPVLNKTIQIRKSALNINYVLKQLHIMEKVNVENVERFFFKKFVKHQAIIKTVCVFLDAENEDIICMENSKSIQKIQQSQIILLEQVECKIAFLHLCRKLAMQSRCYSVSGLKFNSSTFKSMMEEK